MTRGGYGDNTQEKKLRRTARGVDSLSKRPGPVLPQSPHLFRAWMMLFTGSPMPGTVALPAGGSSADVVDFDWWEQSDTDQSVFEPHVTAGFGFSDPPVIGAETIQGIELKQPGHYAITFHALLDRAVWGFHWDWNDGDAPFGYADTFMGGGDREPQDPTGFIYNSIGWVGGTMGITYPMPDYVTEGADPSEPTEMWPNFSTGGSVNGNITVAGMEGIASPTAVTIELAKLAILYTPFPSPLAAYQP